MTEPHAAADAPPPRGPASAADRDAREALRTLGMAVRHRCPRALVRRLGRRCRLAVDAVADESVRADLAERLAALRLPGEIKMKNVWRRTWSETPPADPDSRRRWSRALYARAFRARRRAAS